MCEADSLKYEGVSTQDYAFLTKAGFCGPPTAAQGGSGTRWAFNICQMIKCCSSQRSLFPPFTPPKSLFSLKLYPNLE